MPSDHLQKEVTANRSDFNDKAKKVRERSSKLMQQKNTETTKTNQKVESPGTDHMTRSLNTFTERVEQAAGCEDEAARLREIIAELQLQVQIANFGNGNDEDALRAELLAAKNQLSMMRSKYATVNAELNRIKNTDSDKVKALNSQMETLQKESRTQVEESTSRLLQLQNEMKALEVQSKRQTDEQLAMRENADGFEQCKLRLQEKERDLADLAERISKDEHVQPYGHQDTSLYKLQLEIVGLQRKNSQLREEAVQLKSIHRPRSLEAAAQSEINGLRIGQKKIKQKVDALDHKLFLKIEENDMLHQKLEARTADNEAITKENAIMRKLIGDLEAQAKVYATKDEIIEVIEAQSEMLNHQLATAVEESRGKDSVIYHWKNQADSWHSNYKELEIKMQEYHKQQAASENNNLSSTVNHYAMYPSTCMIADETDTVPLSSTTSVRSSIPVAKVVPVQERFVIDSDMESISSESSTFGQQNSRPIIVCIDPLDRLNWTWVQKMRAAVQRQPVNVEGPREEVNELMKLMNDYEAGDTHRKKQIAAQRKLLARLEKDIEKFKAMPLCRNKTHKCLADDLTARIEQDKLNRMRLYDQDRRMKDLESVQRRSEAEIRHLKRSLENCNMLFDITQTNGFMKDPE